MRLVVDGAELRYEVDGDEGGEPWLVPCAVGIDWVRAALPDRFGTGRRLVVVELRGTASSTAAEESVDLATAVADLEAVRAALGLEGVTVMAHSMTGLIALAYAAGHPAHVARVVAVGTPPALPLDPGPVAEYWERHATDERKRLFEERSAAEAATGRPTAVRETAAWVRLWHDLSHNTEALDALNGVTPSWIQRMGASVNAHDWAATRAAVRCPVLAVFGRSDFGVPSNLWQGDDVGIADLTVAVVDESAHTPFYEQPERFCAVVDEWAASATRSS